jgi:hypothetical protein
VLDVVFEALPLRLDAVWVEDVVGVVGCVYQAEILTDLAGCEIGYVRKVCFFRT